MKVKELLSDETKWIKGDYARDKSGKTAFPNSLDAACWCLHGAIIHCYYQSIKYSSVERLVRKELQLASIHKWNDDPKRTFQDVRKLVEKLNI